MKPLRRSRRWFLTAALPVVASAHRVRAAVIATPDLKRAIQAGASQLSFRLGSAEWEFIRISPGAFRMGSVAGDPDAHNDGMNPAQMVRITRPFYLSKYQVTEAQYQSVMMDNHRSMFAGDDLPVSDLRYRDILEFCRRMSSAVGVSVTLPTEAQWEYACRAGTTTIYYNGNSVDDLKRVAWFDQNSDRRVQAVGKKQPNAWGLHDMLGNLYEPCLDYISSSDFPTDDPMGSRSPDRGICRGGAWLTLAQACRCSARSLTNDIFGNLGIRVAINPR